MSDQHDITLQLTRTEALVLFGWLAVHGDVAETTDTAERIALWALEGQLETSIAEPFALDTVALLEAARRRVRETMLGPTGSGSESAR